MIRIVCNYCGREINEDEDFYSFPYSYHEGGERVGAIHREEHNMCTDCARKFREHEMRIVRGC